MSESEQVNPITMERFTLLVREASSYDDKISVTGKPFGKYDGSRDLYINRSNIPLTKLSGVSVKEENGMMEITFEKGGLNGDLSFAVVTDVEPVASVESGKPIENPFLLGAVREYRDFAGNSDYTNELCFNLVHGRLIVAVYSDELGSENGQVKKGTKVGFPMLTLKDEHKVLPVFTDWAALSKWKNVFDEKHTPKCIVMNFDNATEIGTKDSEGLVINPFDNPVPVPKALIEDIKKSSGYRAERNVKKVEVKKDTPIQIGLPKETEQIKLIKDALTSIGNKDNNIKETYLFVKAAEGHANLLVIYDLDLAVTEEERRAIFDLAFKTILPIAGSDNKIEFAMKAPAFIKLCNGYEPFYKA